MGSVRYDVDEHVDNAVVRGLRRRAVDVMTVPEAGMMGRGDEDQLAFAMRVGRTIFAQDRDFLRLAASGAAHAGVVYAPQGTKIGTIVSGLLLIFNVLTTEEMVGAIEYI